MLRTEYVIESPKVSSDKNIAICSDMHINSHTSQAKIEEVLQTLETIRPTHIVIPGDLYDADNLALHFSTVSEFIYDATLIADVFYVAGNIEQERNSLPYGFINNTNRYFHILCNRTRDGKQKYVYKDGINIAALKLPPAFYGFSEIERTKFLLNNYKSYLEELSQKCGPDNFNVLLCHDPLIKEALDYIALGFMGESSINFDLIISGHNHGGIWPKWMRPVLEMMNVNMELAYPTYTKGMFSAGSTESKIVISEGITRFHSDFGHLQTLEHFHEGTIENVRVLSRKNNKA